MTSELKQKNRTLGLILASVVLVFFLGFMVRLVFFGSPKKPQMAPISTLSTSGATALPTNTSALPAGGAGEAAAGAAASPSVSVKQP